MTAILTRVRGNGPNRVGLTMTSPSYGTSVQLCKDRAEALRTARITAKLRREPLTVDDRIPPSTNPSRFAL